MSNLAHCEFVNDDSPPFLFILPPPLYLCPTIAISLLICLTLGLLDLFQYFSCQIRNLDFSHSTNVEVMYNMDTCGFYSGHGNSLSETHY